jgi:phospholipase C
MTMVQYKTSRLVGILLMVLLVAGCGLPGQTGGQTGGTPITLAPWRIPIKTVFIIVMENESWSDIQGNPNAPYINHTLLPMAAYARQYYTPPGNHPSEPNYLWLEAGTNFGIYNDGPPSENHQATTQHLVTLLKRAGISWKAYEEDISGTICPLAATGEYAPKHNPMVYFDDVTNGNNPNSAYCIAHERPYRELAGDLQRNTVARYNFITPNLCDDMHNACAPLDNPVAQGDRWLAGAVPGILHSRAYQDSGALFITWDEGSYGSDGPIGMIVLSPYAKGGGYANSIHYTHSSTLRTMEEIFGVSPLLGDARDAGDLRDLFK